MKDLLVLQRLYQLLADNEVSSILVDLELLSFGNLRGVGIYKGFQVDILATNEVTYTETSQPIFTPVIRFYQDDKIVHTINFKN